MDVVLNTIDLIQLALLSLYNTPYISVQVFTMALRDRWFPIFCTENDLVINLFIGAHVVSLEMIASDQRQFIISLRIIKIQAMMAFLL